MGGNNLDIEKDRVLKSLKSIVNINTVNPPGNELHLANFIKNYMDNYNLSTDLKTVSENRSNIITTIEGSDSSRPALIFSGHLDTVPIGEMKS